MSNGGPIEKGTVVAVDRCPECGGKVHWQVTGGQPTVYFQCRHADPETLERCGAYRRKSFKEAERFFAAYRDNLGRPVDRLTVKGKAKGEDHGLLI